MNITIYRNPTSLSSMGPFFPSPDLSEKPPTQPPRNFDAPRGNEAPVILDSAPENRNDSFEHCRDILPCQLLVGKCLVDGWMVGSSKQPKKYLGNLWRFWWNKANRCACPYRDAWFLSWGVSPMAHEFYFIYIASIDRNNDGPYINLIITYDWFPDHSVFVDCQRNSL